MKAHMLPHGLDGISLMCWSNFPTGVFQDNKVGAKASLDATTTLLVHITRVPATLEVYFTPVPICEPLVWAMRGREGLSKGSY